MFEKSGSFRSKSAVAVTLKLADQDAFDASVFLRYDERLIDLLNDERAFIPIMGPKGDPMIIAKTNITSITEREDASKHQGEADHASDENDESESHEHVTRPIITFDPYMILRIPRDADLETIKQAYKERIKSVHPDALEALDLDPDLKQAAILSTQKVNRAYKAIMANLKNAANEKPTP